MKLSIIGTVLTTLIPLLIVLYLNKWKSVKVRPKINGEYELRVHKFHLHASRFL